MHSEPHSAYRLCRPLLVGWTPARWALLAIAIGIATGHASVYATTVLVLTEFPAFFGSGKFREQSATFRSRLEAELLERSDVVIVTRDNPSVSFDISDYNPSVASSAEKPSAIPLLPAKWFVTGYLREGDAGLTAEVEIVPLDSTSREATVLEFSASDPKDLPQGVAAAAAAAIIENCGLAKPPARATPRPDLAPTLLPVRNGDRKLDARLAERLREVAPQTGVLDAQEVEDLLRKNGVAVVDPSLASVGVAVGALIESGIVIDGTVLKGPAEALLLRALDSRSGAAVAAIETTVDAVLADAPTASERLRALLERAQVAVERIPVGEDAAALAAEAGYYLDRAQTDRQTWHDDETSFEQRTALLRGALLLQADNPAALRPAFTRMLNQFYPTPTRFWIYPSPLNVGFRALPPERQKVVDRLARLYAEALVTGAREPIDRLARWRWAVWSGRYDLAKQEQQRLQHDARVRESRDGRALAALTAIARRDQVAASTAAAAIEANDFGEEPSFETLSLAARAYCVAGEDDAELRVLQMGAGRGEWGAEGGLLRLIEMLRARGDMAGIVHAIENSHPWVRSTTESQWMLFEAQVACWQPERASVVLEGLLQRKDASGFLKDPARRELVARFSRGTEPKRSKMKVPAEVNPIPGRYYFEVLATQGLAEDEVGAACQRLADFWGCPVWLRPGLPLPVDDRTFHRGAGNYQALAWLQTLQSTLPLPEEAIYRIVLTEQDLAYRGGSWIYSWGTTASGGIASPLRPMRSRQSEGGEDARKEDRIHCLAAMMANMLRDPINTIFADRIFEQFGKPTLPQQPPCAFAKHGDAAGPFRTKLGVCEPVAKFLAATDYGFLRAKIHELSAAELQRLAKRQREGDDFTAAYRAAMEETGLFSRQPIVFTPGR